MDMKTVKAINIPYDQPVYKILDYIHFNGAEAISFSEMLNYRITNYEIEFKVDDDISSYVSPIGVKWDGGGQYYPDNEPTNYVYVQRTPGTGGSYYTGRFVAGNTSVSGQNYGIVKTSDLLSTAPTFDFVWNELVSGNTYRYGYRNFATTTSTREGGLGRMQTRTAADFQGFYVGSCLVINYNGSTFTRSHIYDFKGNIYSFKYNDGVNVYNMVPAQRISDSVCGFYDLDSGEFRAMVGTTITDGAAGNIVRYITTPISASVKKIENSNGDIIWGSYDAFPYRRLEYIHFSGAEGLDLGFKGGLSGTDGSMILTAKIQSNPNYNYGIIIGCAGNSTSSGAMRIFFQSYQNSTLGHRIGRNSSSYSYTISNNFNNKLQFAMRLYTGTTAYFSIRDQNGNNISGSDHYYSSITSYTPSSMPNLQLMRYVNAGNVIADGYSVGDVYSFILYTSDGASAKLKEMYPCQRKSDGVCGLYDVINDVFLPMVGTTITDNAAGPVTNEYWDLTA